MTELRMEGKITLKAYREGLGRMDDVRLRQEWDTNLMGEKWKLADVVEHEMAMRFMGRSENQKGRKDARSYFWDKLLEAAGEFGDLVDAGEYFRAKYLYEQACMLTVFLEMPTELRQRLFGTTTDDGVYIDGLFGKKDVNRVMDACIIRNRLGYDCMVYRIPGEAGYHGARAMPGAVPCRRMGKEENPAYMQEASGQ